MAARRTARRPQSNAYQLFILVLTILSLGVMVGLALPLAPADIHLLEVYDNVIALIFLFDFALNLKRARSKRHYFIQERGWLDLLGSIPNFGISQYGALLRLARLSRFARIARLLRGDARQALVDDLIRNRGQYAAFITVLAAFVVLVVASVFVLQFESGSRDANIRTGGDALWWGIVTITTVGYGDRYPVTLMGRVVAIFVMFAGVGIIGSLASILASVLVPTPEETAAEVSMAPEAVSVGGAGAAPDTSDGLREEMAALREELGALRRALEDRDRAAGPS